MSSFAVNENQPMTDPEAEEVKQIPMESTNPEEEEKTDEID